MTKKTRIYGIMALLMFTSGNMMIEIGEVRSNNSNQIYLDNAYNLKAILEKKFSVNVFIPEYSDKKLGSQKVLNNILIITNVQNDRNKISSSLEAAKDFIIQRHKKKVKLYDDYIMTSQIGDINIGNTAINLPKKALMISVAFVTGFIVSIFLVFIINFIQKMKDEN